ncbi:Glycosyltransferase involved in cell wall bisynthesis [Hymenobacter daecheongensis DSM 21074]|uniref:Glycosyltransferase involved in cell wall bisynthesis n=1 Tax=Hymenobacter daecheongensis DSM 21074 TaxID=1121955 RepID=A0A1M6EH35_9BACT|nr:glycosyltransferase family 4 protein [Hymenobacter daecheongensis]SHI84802.1 Glycosyltransferase involved in cell wall bisynthesis [Hymenobacter daecheongensis DSM 21074]
MRLLVITYYWPPSGGAGVQRTLKFVKYLPSLGVDCTVITVDPERGAYPVLDASLAAEVPAAVRVIRTGTTEPFGSYQKLTGRKQIPYGGFANESKTSFQQQFFKFVRGNVFIPDPRRGWNAHVLRACEALFAAGERFDAVLTSSPPHSTQLIGLALKKRYGLRWLADMRDPWTNIYYAKELNQTAAARWLDARYERQVLEQADEVLVTSPDTKRLFLGKSAKLTDAKFHVLPNGYDESDFREPSAPPTDALLITHTGTISEIYHIELFLAACGECARRHPDVNLRLRFVGKVSQGVQELIRDHELQERTELIPFVPHDESVGYLLRSTVLLMAIPDVDHNFGILPGKVFEYLAANKPIVCIGPVGSDADTLLEECGAGRAFPYVAFGDMLEYLETQVAAWRINPNLDLPPLNHARYSRRSLTERLVRLIPRP